MEKAGHQNTKIKNKAISKIAVVFGTRPEALKLAMVIKALEVSATMKPLIIATGQHREMLDQVLKIFDIKPEHDLHVMVPNQSLFRLTAKMIPALGDHFAAERPELVLVQGDTTTTFAASLAAFYHKIPVGHIEAGLRSHDKYQPFPEETNRRLTDELAQLHFAPTLSARSNLISEGVREPDIFVTGNTIIDALFWILKTTKPKDFVSDNDLRRILVTAHRRENWDKGIEAICRTINRVIDQYRDVEVIFACHLNPRVRDTVMSLLGEKPRIKVVGPVAYTSFVHMISSSYLILTDSGGIQEEAPSLGKPVLLARNVTERPEGIEGGVTRLVGVDEQRIFSEISLLLDDPQEYGKMAKHGDLYGDGKAAERIIEALEEFVIHKRLAA